MSEHFSSAPSGVPLDWNLGTAELRFFGLPGVVLWLNPSLYTMLEPFISELGPDLSRLLLARSAAIGTDGDYQAIMTVMGSTFEEGFAVWGNAARVAGWGVVTLESFDRTAGTALLRISNPFELRMQAAGGSSWGCPFVLGKMIGIFSHAIGRTCWADEEIVEGSALPEILLRIYPSERTLDAEIEALRRSRQETEQAALEQRIEEATAMVRRQGVELEQRDILIRTLSTPIIQVWDGVLVVPLVGDLSADRSEKLIGELLERVVAYSARHVVLDLTGLSVVDAAVAEHLGAAVSALRLVGTECAVVGLSPDLARAMISLQISFVGVRTLRTLADALRDVVGLRTRKSQPGGPGTG